MTPIIGGVLGSEYLTKQSMGREINKLAIKQ